MAVTQFHPEKSQTLGLALIAKFPEVEAVTRLKKSNLILFPRLSTCKSGECVRLKLGDMNSGYSLQHRPGCPGKGV